MNSIFIKLFWFFYLFFIIKFSTIHAQKCSLQVFSEFDNYDLFIDNNFIGSNITKLDSIECGDHYIKISYQDIIIFSEIITFNSTSTKKILIKRTKEIE
ncbi:MAG: hypothetical protein N2203_08845, partial [Bacteroidia bacterium]|nr:hypothetical protein [Bacteroidia bacterium]